MIYLTVTSLFLLTVIVLILLVKQRWNVVLTVVLVPFLLFNVAFSWHTIESLWGQPREGLPEDSFQIIYQKSDKPWIYLLVVEPEVDYPIFRKIPWTKQNQETLEKGQRAKKEGKVMIAKKKETADSSDEQIELYEWDFKRSMPKD